MEVTPDLISKFVLLWAVIDPVGTVPVFISATSNRSPHERRHIAIVATVAAALILLFFIVAGEVVLVAMGVPMPAFQIAGGIILFLFALTMVFGESKPESETKMLRSVHDIAIYPLATPSIASPGAMMAVVLLTKNDVHTIMDQVLTSVVMFSVLAIACGLMLIGGWIARVIGTGGASIISRVMGLILASVAAANVLEGAKEYFGSVAP
ncbi:MarC family protein [Aeoliella sp.]|uniref:MarC family protein n=1 Tax=Aeoliella sp. TaxID=2795800 RepID=UPI003CCBE816